jgi:hypothetical protein
VSHAMTVVVAVGKTEEARNAIMVAVVEIVMAVVAVAVVAVVAVVAMMIVDTAEEEIAIVAIETVAIAETATGGTVMEVAAEEAVMVDIAVGVEETGGVVVGTVVMGIVGIGEVTTVIDHIKSNIHILSILYMTLGLH